MINPTLRVFGWATYLCCSWMWCIGLFYPVLLYRDFGDIAWYFFVIPNVVGASVVPWLIKSAKLSEEFTCEHSLACRFFSFVTILFQLFFMIWALISFGITKSIVVITIFICFFIFFLCSTRILIASLFSFFFSILALLIIFKLSDNAILIIPRQGEFGVKELFGLLPVFLIGFFFCPYLDLTFHRAIKENNGLSIKFIYVIAFLGLFLSLLILGLAYFPVAYHMFFGENILPKSFLQFIFYLYLIVQISFTCIVHIHELLQQKIQCHTWVLFIFILISVLIINLFANFEITLLGRSMHIREVFYRCFLSFYGLVFPLYIWIFVVNAKFATLKSQKWIAWLVVTLIVVPFYAIGFLGNPSMIIYVLPVSVLILLLAPGIFLYLGCVFFNQKSIKSK